ncbi:YkvA family protein [Streptomyces sp. BH106]|uniref:YkvA family protein n=1 Tax=Streptomyces sp. BH106 TaxID=3410409 RepID=UPI003CED89AA
MDSTTWIVLGTIAAVAMLVAVVVLLVRVFKARKLLVDAGIPLHNKALFWAAIAYTISPVDLLPDPVYLDDIGVLLVALKMLHGAAHRAGLRGGGPELSGPAANKGRTKES